MEITFHAWLLISIAFALASQTIHPILNSALLLVWPMLFSHVGESFLGSLVDVVLVGEGGMV